MIRGEIWWADFGVPFGSEPGFKRPIMIVQDDDFNRSKINTVIVLPLTTNLNLEDAPGNLLIEKEESSLPKDSVVVVSQLYAIDKERLIEKIKKIDSDIMYRIEEGIMLVLGLKKYG
jgi:mRNA interferase MazF